MCAATLRSPPVFLVVDTSSDGRAHPSLPCTQVERYTPFICGEESFGTGSNHIREKDSLWAVMAWLSILADANPEPSQPLVGVKDIVQKHWTRFGRHFYCRYDYEAVDSDAALEMMDKLRSYFETMADTSTVLAGGLEFGDLKCTSVEEFMYVDPVDNSMATKQGMILNFKDDERAVFRLSGTGSEGSTIRLYLEAFADTEDDIKRRPLDVLAPVAAAALEASNLAEITGRDSPTVIT